MGWIETAAYRKENTGRKEGKRLRTGLPNQILDGGKGGQKTKTEKKERTSKRRGRRGVHPWLKVK